MAKPYIPLKLALVFGLCLMSVQGAPLDRLFPTIVSLPEPGAQDLRVLTPDLLELRIVQSPAPISEQFPPPGPLENPDYSLKPMPPGDFEVTANGKRIRVLATGLRRVPVYADYYTFEARIILQIFLKLESPIPDHAEIAVRSLSGLPNEPLGFHDISLTDRFSPAIHVSAHGFTPDSPKFAFVSYDLGTLGAMDLPGPPEAHLLDEKGESVFAASLDHRPDQGWDWYQNVWRFNFSAVSKPGTYFVEIPGLGRSAPVRIDESASAVTPRLLALGFYNQRSGEDKGEPYTRFGHRASHTRPAAIPDTSDAFRATNRHIAAMAKKNSDPAVQSAPMMKSVADSLYPILLKDSKDVSGGHYDAGDYSKYVINSAQVIHALVFAVDHFPGVDRIDNLGLPESGDGVPDALQIALREAVFLLKMQDLDGGFFFLVYPKNRAYELDVLPEDGDPQVVFPKNTGATAACTGALAQLAASPQLKKSDPAFASKCLAAAQAGYQFLKSAIATHGLEGSYQAISHYGNFDTHRDELSFAAAALFVATGQPAYKKDLQIWWPDPLSGRDKKWGWLPLYEAYGSAARVYAFAEAPGFLPVGSCDPSYLAAMRTAILRAGETWLDLADANAFGLPVSLSAKRQKRAGWFWAMDPGMDLAAASLLTPGDSAFEQRVLEALAMWSAYEAGGNPFHRALITGTGPVWRRQAVNRISLNDDRRLAPPGIPIGNVVSTPHNLKPYQIHGANGLRKFFFPFLDKFPLYERSATDTYNVREEWTVATGAKLLAGHLFLMGRSPVATAPWIPQRLELEGFGDNLPVGETIHARIAYPEGLCGKEATVVWELIGAEPTTGPDFSAKITVPGSARLEAEVVWPDGKRLSVTRKFLVVP